jgi:glucose-6-phosphate 1-dehydrogenase
VSPKHDASEERVGYEVADRFGDDQNMRIGGVARLGEAPSPFGGERHPDPCSLVVFGVTGDLTHRKLMPALYDLGCHDVLPFGTTIVGYGRQELTDDGFRALLQESIDDHYGADAIDGDLCDRILQTPRYVQGQFDDSAGYARLAAVLAELDAGGTRGNRMFYLATPPSQFGVIVEQLGASGLAGKGAADGSSASGEPVTGWTRVVIEKPFGRDLETARDLNRVIAEVFDEGQVYRIDHYLAKETVQNLLVLRFANGIFEPVWNRRYVDFVEITAAETLGVEHRGPYYEEAGALRDMITPHLIQLFSLVAMEPPVAFGADAVRDEKLKVLRAVRPIPHHLVSRWAVRAQYVQGVVDGEGVPAYRAEERVAPDSHTETYAAVKLLVDNWRWQGVPFYLRTGKRLARRVTEIAIHFKLPPVLLFRDAAAGRGLQSNVLVLRVQPDEGFSLNIESKLPGHGAALQPVAMDYS